MGSCCSSESTRRSTWQQKGIIKVLEVWDSFPFKVCLWSTTDTSQSLIYRCLLKVALRKVGINPVLEESCQILETMVSWQGLPWWLQILTVLSRSWNKDLAVTHTFRNQTLHNKWLLSSLKMVDEKIKSSNSFVQLHLPAHLCKISLNYSPFF